jgi:predicted  nucleic acid-binding Zn-ribbon protein
VETSRLEQLLSEHLKADQNRLDRIEVKIDRLSETVVAIARAEEKLVSLEESKKEIWHTIDTHEDRLDKHEERLNSGATTINTINQLFWILIAAAAAGIVSIWIQ